MRKLLLLGSLVVSLFLSLGQAPKLHAQTNAADRALDDFLASEWQRHLKDNPIDATLLGDHRYDRELPDLSPAAIDAEKRARRTARQQLGKLMVLGLSPASRLNGEIYAWSLDRDIAEEKFCGECTQVSQIGGPHELLADLLEYAPPQTVKEAEDLLVRMDKYPDYLQQARAWLDRGIKQKIVPPRVVVEKVPAAIRKELPAAGKESRLVEAFAKLPERIPAADRARLLAAARETIGKRVVPALTQFADYLEKSYLPKCRDTVGIAALPNGRDWYRLLVSRYTTLPLDPEDVHRIGLEEVTRISAEMEKVKTAAGFPGTLAEYFTFLRTDPKFYYTEREELLRGYRDIAKRIDGELPRLFGKLPRLPYGVAPVPSYSEETAFTAFYVQGSVRDGRAGRFYANTYKLSARPKWEMEALTLHESVPGHHLQIALAQEATDLPTFRQHLYIEAFGEGWGLYAESLGRELGLYQTPPLQMGQLIYEMWRAVRLVVDTGIHHKGWTRQQAITFFEKNTGKSAHDIAVEVDRYIAWPGQALAYKIGQRKLQELRRRAEQKLGTAFDVRRFHDAVLESGALPLPMIETRIDRFIANESARK